MTGPVTIAHLIATNFYGGPEKQILNHAIRLDKERFRFVLITFVEKGEPNQLEEMARSNGVEVVQVHVQNPFDPVTIWRILAILRRLDVELICAHGYKSNVIGRLASWLGGVPQIAISRGWTAENRRIRFYEKLDKFFLRLADCVVAVSHGQREKIVALGVPSVKVAVIHNAIDLVGIPAPGLRGLRRELGLPDDAIVITSAGRLSPEKNYAAMIEASRELIKGNPRVYFVIFGEGFLRGELERKIESAGLSGRFLLPGFRSDLQQVMHEVDIFMLPSFTEGLPNVVLEAFAARKPVVATRVGGTPEVVQEGTSGFLTRPDQPELMASHLSALVADHGLREGMGHAGYAYIEEHFDFAAQTAAYERLYTDLHSAKKRRP
ncbi:MAG: group 1 glycosyl transferase [Geobacteraceae bacterium GWC2_58_44]|nr:MAG: group 1 glycosyl transferase [Geobacteraceae bacterium GWC2_58_44]HBG07893.1 group 1 glycosyl transferase [Geobacter sp.]